MRKFIAMLVVIAGGSLLASLAAAQETNPCPLLPATKLEAFETNTETVIIKATAPIGGVPGRGGTVSVRCREITDAGTGQRASGVIIDIASGGGAGGGHAAD